MNARKPLTATDIGCAVAELRRRVQGSGRLFGVVVGSFSFGFYFRIEQSVFAVAGPALPQGPAHIVLDADPPAPREQSIIAIDLESLAMETGVVDLSRACHYRPHLPSTRRLRALAPLLAQFDRVDLAPDDLLIVWSEARDAVRRGDLHAARRLLQGRGGGLTPTGDDVLAGILLLSHWTEPCAASPREVASLADTTDLSRSFLTWAAVGQSIRPVHDLVEAIGPGRLLAADDRRLRFNAAAEAVSSIGATSGRAMLAGLAITAAAWLTRYSRQTSRDDIRCLDGSISHH